MSQPARTKQDVVAEFRQSEIIAAARRVIARDGPRKTSMERIAEEANISKGTLYLYFDSKDALVQEATERAHAEMAAYVDDAMRAADSPVAAIDAYVRSTLRFCDEHEMLFRAMTSYPDSEAGATSKAVARHVDKYVGWLQEAVERGVAAGHFRPVRPQQFARMLVEAVRGIVIVRLREKQPASISDDADAILGVFIDGIRSS